MDIQVKRINGKHFITAETANMFRFIKARSKALSAKDEPEVEVLDDVKQDVKNGFSSIFDEMKRMKQQLEKRKEKGDTLYQFTEDSTERGATFDFAGIGKIDVEKMDDPDLDFDEAFDKLKSLKVKVADMKMERLESDPIHDNLENIENIIDEATETVTQLQFQASSPAAYKGGKPSTERKAANPQKIIKQIRRVLHEEFVTPAYSKGLPVLATVWQGIGQVKSQYPDEFEEAFSLALTAIRNKEDAVFCNILEIDPAWTAKNILPSAEVKEPLNKLIHILGKYYDLVLTEAKKNQKNLVERLETVRKEAGDDKEFIKLFKEALEIDRKIEEEAFGDYLLKSTSLKKRQ